MNKIFWACLQFRDGLSPLISASFPPVMFVQAVANCCNVGVFYAPGDIRHPQCAKLATYRNICLATAVRTCTVHLADSAVRRQHGLGVCLRCRPGTRNFHQCAEQMEQPLDVKFGLSSHNLCTITLFPSLSRT